MPQYELNLRDYVRIFRRRRAMIIFTFILVLAGSIFFSKEQAPFYEAVTTVKLEERKTVAGLLTEWIVYSPGDMMESETQLIRGNEIMKKTAIKMGMISADSDEQQINQAIGKIVGMVKAEREGTTNIIRIIASADNAQFAIETANTVASVYIEENLLGKTLQARSARQFIQEQLAALDERLKEKEETLKKLSEETNNISLAAPMQEKLTELQFELSSILQKYTERHPSVIELRERIAELQKQTKGLSGEDLNYARLFREVEADKRLYSLLKEKLEEARITEAQKVGDISVVNPAVTASIVAGPNKTFGILVSGILGIVLGFAFALIIESLDTSIATIEDVESIMKVPVLGVIPSVMMGEELKSKRSFLKNFRKRVLHKQNTELEERYVRLLLQYNPTSPVAEAYRNVHTNLKLDQSRKTLLITSAGPREGKSTCLTNLGLAIAQTGIKTLIISADIRRPVIAKAFGIKREPGLTEVLLGMVPFDEAVRNVTDYMLGSMDFDQIKQTPGLDNLWLLTSGQLPFNPAKILESKEFERLNDELREKFDLVIYDSPPVLPVTDASIMASKMDMVIMIYEIGRTSRDALLRAKTQLDAVGAKICGVILNQTRNETDVDVLYPYYYKYRYYREEPEKKSVAKNKVAV
ncbi:MAG: polysaccharide biosynthesis tyrosine autokinase [Candidatus Omnitrophica bacterium]|nr:polysaccharide biosynthesis tyrosine autokinase [Candidatus Omnitrophota bacterium]